MWARNLLLFGLIAAWLAWVASRLALPVAANADPAARDASGAMRHVSGEIREAARRIDAALDEVLQSQAIAPAARASELAIARRLSLALMGTVPSLEEIRQIETVPTADRTRWWLDQILADRRYADYWGERLARAYVGIDEGPFLLYRRRRFVSWLSDQLHENRPYSETVRELIAGTGLWTDNPATNFITACVLPVDNILDENKLAVRVSRSLLGLRLDCAQCHDHPFEPRWQQRDFQSLAAFFGGTRPTLTGIQDGAGVLYVEDEQGVRRDRVDAAVPFLEEQLPDSGSGRRRLSHWLTDPGNKPFAHAMANRAWALLFGKGLVEPIDDLPLDGPLPPALERLADEFTRANFDIQHLIRVIAATEAFQRQSRVASPRVEQNSPASAGADHWAAFPISRLRPEQVVGGLIQSASLTTIDHHSHILIRLARQDRQREFIMRYGDTGADEMHASAGTIAQRLLMLNGDLVYETTKDNFLGNAATRIAVLAPDDARAVETAYLVVLTRRPSPPEAAHFQRRLHEARGRQRIERLGDLCWTLLNSTEFSWNH